MVLPDGQSPQRVSPHGWSIGKSIRGKRQPVVVLPIAIPLANSLVVTSRLFLVVMNYTSPLCAKVVIIALTISGLTQNWLEYPAASKPHRGMQRLKCSVAESESHRIVFHYLTPSVYEKRVAKTEHSHPLGMIVSTHFRCGKGIKRGLKNGALPFNID